MKEVYVIHEKDLEDGEQTVIGAASSLDKIQSMIDEYYGEHKEISYTDIRDSGLEYTKVLEIPFGTKFERSYRVEVTVMWFNLDEV